MNIRKLVWWCLFLPVALVLQLLLPGLDALVIGLIILLQERSYKDMLWMLPLLIIIQEGIGSREFGGMVLWYAMVIGLFLMGRWLFEVENLLFVFLLSACLGASHFGLACLLAPLQNLHVDVESMADESLIQAIFIPIAWWLAYLSRRWVHEYDEKA